MTALAEYQKKQGDDVWAGLIQSSSLENEYYRRLRAAGVRIVQWPVWLNRLSGDWEAIERLLTLTIRGLSIVFSASALILSYPAGRPRQELRESLKGRFRTSVRSILNKDLQRKLFQYLLATYSFLRSPNVVHIHSYGAGMEFVSRWARRSGLPCIHQEHSTPDGTRRRWYDLPTSDNEADIVVSVSRFSGQALRDRCGITQPIEVIPPIVAADLDMRPAAAASSRNCVKTVLTVARLTEEKGLLYLIEAAREVVTGEPDVRFLVYGEGPLREALESRIESEGLADRCILAGEFRRADLASVLRSADLFVLPSVTEGMPVTVIEAMLFGLPIVATKVGGIPDLLRDGSNALLCPPADAPALANAILTLIRQPAKGKELGRRAYESLRNSDFTPERIVSRFNSVYSDAARIHRRVPR